MINLENNYFDILNDVFTIIMNNPLYMFVLSFGIFSFITNLIIKLFFRGLVSFNSKDDEDITYAEEYDNNECENDDDRFNYGFFKK